MKTSVDRGAETDHESAPRVHTDRWGGLASALLSVILLGLLGTAWGRLGNPLSDGDLLGVYAATSVPGGHSVGGYPFGMNLWPHFQTLDIIPETMKFLIYELTGNEYLAVNLIWLASFPICAGLSCWLFRRASAPPVLAVVLGVAFTFIPFHWVRGFVHPYIATMWSAVLGTILAILVGSGRVDEIWQRFGAPPRRSIRKRLWLVIAAIVVALSGIYYAFFAMVLMAVALGWLWVRGAGARTLLRSSIPLGVVLVAVATVFLAAGLAAKSDPTSQAVLIRHAGQSVIYAGALAFLVVPSPVSDLPGAAGIGHSMDPYVNTGIESLGYGQFGSAVTSVAMVVYAVGWMVLVRRRHRDPESVESDGRHFEIPPGLVALLLCVSILLFVPWSANFLFALWFSPGIRSWDRLLPIILLLAMVGAIQASRRLRLVGPTRRTWILSGVILVVVLLDGVVPYPAAVRGGLKSGAHLKAEGERYAAEVNRAVPQHCGVLQLPYVPFPEKEVPIGTMEDYQHFLVALTNDDKSWSYGAVKDTAASAWAARLSDHLTQSDLVPLHEGGFCGVHVDRTGYLLGNRSPALVELRALLGAPVVTAHQGDWEFFLLPGSGPTKDVNDERTLSPAARQFYYPGE